MRREVARYYCALHMCANETRRIVYENIGLSYHAFACWMEEHRQYEIAGPSRQICHIGSWDESDSQKFLTEVQTPVRRILTLTP